MTPYALLRPLLFRLDAETAHRWMVRGVATLGALPGGPAAIGALWGGEHPALASTLWGRTFPNPIGLAAGFDKDGVLLGPLLALGFGFVEAGSVTPRPQPGNPRPRLFRLPEERALINRMGFNNAGAAALAARLAGLPRRAAPVGVNLGKNRDTPLEEAGADYCAALRAVHAGADYVVVNVSSPNTPGLRDLQHRALLERLIPAVCAERDRLGREAALGAGQGAARRLPLLVKLAPDLDEDALRDVLEVSRAAGVDGLIATNTSTGRAGLRGPLAAEAGGLSGRPLRPAALRAVAALYRLSGGRMPLVGVGGVGTAEDAYALIRAGASLVQVYTALVYEGPGLVPRLKQGLARLLARDGYSSVSQAVGADHRR